MTGRYEKRSRMLLYVFDWQVRQSRSALVEALGRDRAEAALERERDEFIALIPSIGDIGPLRNYFTWEALIGVMSVARYRALRAAGLGNDECARIMYAAYEAIADSFPPWIASLLRRATHSLPMALYMRAQAKLSRKKRRPEFFVFDYVEADAENDWGLDFHECAIKKFCDEVGEPDCLPMICTVDFAVGRRFGWGLRRERTISGGDDVCTFRFERTRDTPSPA